MPRLPAEKLEDVLGYRFRNRELLFEALTHSSFAREKSGQIRDNEQLEFLGDAVLSFVVSAKLAEAFPDYPEGKLSRARARLVGTDHLSAIAERLELGAYLSLGRGEEKTGGRSKCRLTANALEALVAALYRDGGLRAAQRFISRFVLPKDLAKARDELFLIDYKSALQERLQAARLGTVSYRVAAEQGPEHRKTFLVEVSAFNESAQGSGESKKVAEQEAARALLEIVDRKLSSNE